MRTTDIDAINNKVLDTRRHEVELRRVEQVYMLHKNVLGVGDIHQVRTHLLLNDRIRGDIGHVVFLFEVEGIPHFPVLAVTVLLERTTHSEGLVPDLFLHFLLLDRPPVETLSVECSVAGDGYVLQFGTIDAGVTLLTAVTERIGLLDVQFLVG